MKQGSMPTTGRYGWYEDHRGEIYQRVSSLVKKVETDKDALDKWFRRQVLLGAARRNDLITAVKAMGPPDPVTGWTKEQKKLQDELAEKAMEAAKDSDGAITGTAVHTLTERVDRGEDLEAVCAGLPATVGTDLRAYAALRRLNGWVSVEIERTVVNDEVEAAGTFDRIDLVPGLAALLGTGVCQYGHGPGDEHFGGHSDRPFEELPVVVDVKTEENPTMNGLHIGPQLAIYSRAQRMWVPNGRQVQAVDRSGKPKTYPNSGDPIMLADGEYLAAPCVRQDVAIVVHVRNGDAVPLFIDLAFGWRLAQRAAAQRADERIARRRLGAHGSPFAAVPNVVRPRPAEVLTDHAVAQQYADPNRPGPGLVVPPVSGPCLNCAPLVSKASSTRVDGSEYNVPCTDCGALCLSPYSDIPYQVATRRADGMVEWQPEHTSNDLSKTLIREIWLASTVERLGELWQLAQDNGVPWRGPVEQAGAARHRIVSCVQRAMHDPATTSKCACGWSREVSP